MAVNAHRPAFKATIAAALALLACQSTWSFDTPAGVASGWDLASDMAIADYLANRDDTAADSASLVMPWLMLAPVDRFEPLIASVKRNGGVITHTADEIGYIRAELSLPAAQAVRPYTLRMRADMRFSAPSFRQTAGKFVEKTSGWDVAPRRPKRPTTDKPDATGPQITADLARQYPYSYDSTIALDRLWREEPTVDGRGTGIAMLETGGAGLPLEHPAFAEARALDGRPRRKILDILVPAASDLADEGNTLVPWSSVTGLREATTTSSLVRRGGIPFVVPEPGQYRLGEWHLPDATYFVLWQPERGLVWVDTNRNFTFTDEKPLRDARQGSGVSAAIGELPRDTVWTSGRFATLQEPARNELFLIPQASAHVLMTASVAAGTDANDNLAVGLAPGASIVAGSAPTTLHGYLWMMRRAALHAEVDFIVSAQVPARTWPEEIEGFIGLYLDRLIERHDKPIFRAASNWTSFETGEGGGRHVTAVGALADGQAIDAFFGTHLGSQRAIWPYSSRGPMVDGSIVPTVVIPPLRIAGADCSSDGRRYDNLRMPRCYNNSTGTSASVPALGGLAATLWSGVRQKGWALSRREVVEAIVASARPIPGASPSEQGHGLPDAFRAWQLLNAKAAGKHRPADEIEIKGQVHHRLQDYLASPPPALFEREGWSVRDRRIRTLQLRRVTGASGALTYDVGCEGDCSTFTLPKTVALRKDAWTPVRVEVKPTRQGVHSALARLTRADGVRALAIPLTILATDRSASGGAKSVERHGTIGVLQRSEAAVFVPEGSVGLHVEVTASEVLNVHFSTPAGWRDSTGTLRRAENGRYTLDMTLPYPMAGTWLLEFTRPRPLKDSEAGEATFKAVVSPILGTSSSPAAAAASAASVEQTGRLSADAPFKAIDVTVPSDQDVLDWKIEASAPVHAYVYDCSSGMCLRKEVMIPASTRHAAQITRPSAGRWRLVVTPRHPGDAVTFTVWPAWSQQSAVTAIDASR